MDAILILIGFYVMICWLLVEWRAGKKGNRFNNIFFWTVISCIFTPLALILYFDINETIKF